VREVQALLDIHLTICRLEVIVRETQHVRASIDTPRWTARQDRSRARTGEKR
jgi:hypothetical protein